MSHPIKIYEDNTGAINIANYENFTKNSKHIEIHYHFVKESVKEKEIEIIKIDLRKILRIYLQNQYIQKSLTNSENC